MSAPPIPRAAIYRRCAVRAGWHIALSLFWTIAAVSTTASLAGPAPDNDDGGFAGLRAADLRLATTLFHLSRANDPLCLRHDGLSGLVVHRLGDYDQASRDAARRYFSFESSVGVEGVVEDSPADHAGVEADDSIVAVDGRPVGEAESRDEVTARLEAGTENTPIMLLLQRRGTRRTLTVRPIRGCVADGEVRISDKLNADTDGATIQVDSGVMNLVTDEDEFAALVAHELAHIILDHPRRLTEARVARGLLRGVGRNGRLFRQTENEADRLSVTLLANAGYDPIAAVRYWRLVGPLFKAHGGWGRTHLPWDQRAALIAAEVKSLPVIRGAPMIPAWLSSRTQPLR